MWMVCHCFALYRRKWWRQKATNLLLPSLHRITKRHKKSHIEQFIDYWKTIRAQRHELNGQKISTLNILLRTKKSLAKSLWRLHLYLFYCNTWQINGMVQETQNFSLETLFSIVVKFTPKHRAECSVQDAAKMNFCDQEANFIKYIQINIRFELSLFSKS